MTSSPIANSIQSAPINGSQLGVTPVAGSKVQASTNEPVTPFVTSVTNVISNVASQIASVSANPIPSNVSPQQTVASATIVPTTNSIGSGVPNVNSLERSAGTSDPVKQIIPAAISSFPSTVVSQVQSQVSGIQSQVTSVGGNVVNQIQDQMSSAQSQVASIPSTVSGMLPTGILPSSGGKKVTPVVSSNIVEQPALLSGPINQTTKLVIDVEEHIKKYLPADDLAVTTISPPSVYAAVESKDERQQTQIQSLIDQVNGLSTSIEVSQLI